jgi:hypothetical protein
MKFDTERKPQQHLFMNKMEEFENRLLPFEMSSSESGWISVNPDSKDYSLLSSKQLTILRTRYPPERQKLYFNNGKRVPYSIADTKHGYAYDNKCKVILQAY